MHIVVIKKKAASQKELGKDIIDIAPPATLRELLIAVLCHEYQRIQQSHTNILSQQEIRQLARLGKVSFSIDHPKLKPLDDIIKTMLQDFDDGLYRIFINGQEQTQIDKQIHLHEMDEVVFLRFVMLAGRLW